ncbi:hypothetical protein D3C76_889820 [compost metagenome]
MGGAQQLLLVELQGDRFVEQGREFAVEALQQVAAGDRHFQQRFAQWRGDVFRRLVGQQLVDIGDRAAHLLALLVDLELVQAGVGDLVGQVAVDLQVRQGLLLLVEDLRQQQAALEHVDLLVQRLVGLGQAVELLLGAQVLLGQFVEAIGAFEQVVGKLEVDRAFAGQQAAAAGLLGFDRLLGDGLLGLGQALVVDQRLQVLDFLLQARRALDQQVVSGTAKVLQQAVAGQLLTAQQGQRVERGQLGVELVALVGVERLAVVLARLEVVVDLLGAGLAVADLGLGALWAGLGIDDQAVGFGQRLLQLTLQGAALAEQLLKLRHREGGVALGDRLRLAVLEPGQFFLAVVGFFRRAGQLLLERGQLLLAVFLAGKQAQGLLQHLLQGLLIGLGQLALGNLVEAVLDAGSGRRFGRGVRGGREREGQAQPE